MKITTNNKLNLTLILNGALVGLITAIFIQFFRFILDRIAIYRNKLIIEHAHSITFIISSFAILIILAIFVGYLVKKEPKIGGSGIAQAKAYVELQEAINHRRQFIYKYIGSIVVLASGLTAGRVGPGVHFGTMIGIEVGKHNNLGKDYTKLLVLGGIASGICSVFNAPLAGIIFVLEIITDDADENVLTVMLSSVFSSYFFVNLFYNEPAFALRDMPKLPLNYYGLLVILILFTIVFSKIFNELMLKTFLIMKKIPLKNEYLPLIPFTITGILYFVNLNFIGFEHELLMELKASYLSTGIAVYFIVKLFLTLLTYGSRVPGGLFYPLIFLGSVAGLLIFKLGAEYFSISDAYMLNFVALGIVAFLTGVNKAPLTATILITELTATYVHLLPVIFTALMVQIGTDYLDVDPVHDLLVRNNSSD